MGVHSGLAGPCFQFRGCPVIEVERRRLICKLIHERSVVSVADLVDVLGASEATVRRDINALADEGQLRRIRGGAEALTPRHESRLVGVPFELSQGIGVGQKRAIAKAAVELIADGESIIINGGTTTCHSLWMGAPVVTLAGDRHASRMGLSFMSVIGLPEFVAQTPDEYVAIAARFAADLPALANIRAGMRDRINSSPLVDGARYTRNLEVAYRAVWRDWCASGK